ncbi:MAG: hypothetical protein HZC05_04095, partial [Candidatus Magasanikbacteria bacterium]|nr:hypothetical protein [Candidatus Magasanikbacteria bacterium]
PACGYIENGICMLNNCTYNGDSWVGIDNGSLPGDSVPTYADGKPIPPMNTTPYVCPNPDKPPKVCMPKVAEDARCIFYDYKTDSNPDCDLSQTDHCWCSGGFYDQTDCSSQSLCQKVPPEAYPPCVCWEFCGYAGEWRCSDTVSINVTIAESTDGSYCAIDINEGAFKLIGKPNEPPPRYPLDNPVSSLTLTENGVNYSEDNSYTWHCTAVTE